MKENLKNKVYEHLSIFAKNLKAEREVCGLTQKSIATLMGISPQSYQAYEGGVAMPTAENLLKISIILEVSIDELFGIEK